MDAKRKSELAKERQRQEKVHRGWEGRRGRGREAEGREERRVGEGTRDGGQRRHSPRSNERKTADGHGDRRRGDRAEEISERETSRGKRVRASRGTERWEGNGCVQAAKESRPSKGEMGAAHIWGGQGSRCLGKPCDVAEVDVRGCPKGRQGANRTSQ